MASKRLYRRKGGRDTWELVRRLPGDYMRLRQHHGTVVVDLPMSKLAREWEEVEDERRALGQG